MTAAKAFWIVCVVMATVTGGAYDLEGHVSLLWTFVGIAVGLLVVLGLHLLIERNRRTQSSRAH